VEAGGLYTALRLAAALGKVGTTEIMVEQSDRFLFSPLLYELLTGELQTGKCPLLKKFYITLVRFCQGVVTGIDIDQRRVQLQDGPDFL